MDLYNFPQAFRGLVLNGHRSAAGELVTANERDTIRVNAFDFSRLQQRDQREPLHLLTGGDLGDATLAFRYLAVGGTVKASSGAKLSDKIAAILQAFDVEQAQLDDPSSEGVSAYTFTDVTEVDTGRGTAFTDEHGNPGFYVAERFLARPAAFPIISQRRSGGDSAGFAVELVCPDPRRYLDTAEAVVVNAGSGWAGTLPNWDAAMGKAVAPLITIVLAGAGHAAFTVTLAGAEAALVLDLSGIGASTVTVDCAAGGVIKVNGTERADLRTSDVTTLGQYVPGGGTTAAVANPTNVTSVTFAYRQARM